jgi:hypothetical protein
VFVARGECDHEARRVADYVRIGYHVASSVEDDTRAQSYRCLDLYDLGRNGFDDAHEALLQARLTH